MSNNCGKVKFIIAISKKPELPLEILQPLHPPLPPTSTKLLKYIYPICLFLAWTAMSLLSNLKEVVK